MTSSGHVKTLVALDFDHTIIDDNSDISVTHLAPDGKIPQEIQDKFNLKGWTHYMGAIFKYLHENGITENDYQNCMYDLPFTDGMKELMRYLANEKYEVVIISDSNSKFISYVLENADLQHTVDKVYTNPAKFDENGCLTIKFCHEQDWCDLSTENLCKGHLLQEYIKDRSKEGVTFSCVVYVGDGTNDLCPALTLETKDYICPRKDFRLWKKMRKLGLLDGEASDLELKAKILSWESGLQILELLKSLE